jgi:hypothetical protein
MSNAELASLARERLARRGPPPAPTTPSWWGTPPLSGAFFLWLLALLLAVAGYALSQRAACGCGTPEQTLQGVLGGLGQAMSAGLSGNKDSLKDAMGSLSSFGNRLSGMTESCDSKVASGVCYTACRWAGMDVQRELWRQCFRGGAKALVEDQSRTGFSHEYYAEL